jgi:hypothetical protein
VEKLDRGIIAVRMIIRVVILETLTIHGKNKLNENEKFHYSSLLSCLLQRCFVGDTPDQWRTCSEKYFPTKSPISSSGSSGGVTRFPNRKKGEIYQSPPRPGGLQHDEVPSGAKLWPVTFLHSEGPPNSTDISNVIDCKKDKC